MIINIFVVINQTNKHKAKIYNHSTYTKIIIKEFYSSDLKKMYVLVNIRMIDLSLDKLRLITQSRNVSDYANKSKEDLKKALNESEPKPKPEIKPKPKTKLKPEPKPKPELKIEIKVNGKKLKKLGKDFDELRHKFSKKEIKEYRKAFHDTTKYKLFG